MEKNAPPPYTENAYPRQPGFQPPPQAYTYGPMPNQQGVVMVSGSPIAIPAFGPESQSMTCPHCHHQITSRVESEPVTKTHLFALILCLFGCIPCCLIPYCTDSCQNRNHYCPSCSAFLGAYTN